ncbi:MAG: CDP-diacylglycerol--glycerol-3-phosphate 3-phosphatidyltransferase [Chlamydiae bacterium]|nr:CDP-diacylglycerol--glycerol-3-phosphate 3-phosphatidyltransferase [Chlamydiota bacterium]MBI3267209.1 CDP-diacylglycerol--glycerol-3-phosphate 3-phosphatidyltransferase [Chlamydiota bacterium]
MNLPNQLTSLRILLMPLTFYLVFQNSPSLFLSGYVLATLVGFTDYFDGYLARRYGIVTKFGKFLDPLADKIFVVILFLYFLSLHALPSWFVILVLIRELAMTDLRILVRQERRDIRVNLLGKRKALFQYILLFHLGFLRWLELIHEPLLGLARNVALFTKEFLVILVTFFTVFSMVYYLWMNRDILWKKELTIS